MKRIALFITTTLSLLTAQAAEPWRLRLENNVEQATLKIDLYEESVDVPGMELLGPMNGYFGGKGVYGVWMVTSFDIKDDRTATLHLSNDQGSETQSIRLTQQTDSTYLMELQGGVVVKRAVNRKLVKIPSKIVLNVK